MATRNPASRDEPEGRKGKRDRANGEGTVYQRNDGRWVAEAYVLASDGSLKRVQRYARTRKAAYDRLTALQENSNRNIAVPNRPWKLGEYLDYWLEHVAKPSVRATTYAKYEQMVRLYLKPELGSQRLDRLRVATIQTCLNGRLKGGDSIAKVHAMRTTLSSALTRAMREELITVNPARLVTLPAESPERLRPWNAEEGRRFLDHARSHHLYPVFVLMLIYGLRRGEVLGLSWEDVDLEQDVMSIRRQVQRVDGSLELVEVKTRAGRRSLPLLSWARDALTDQAQWQTRKRRTAGEAWVDTGLVFTTRTGRAIQPRNLSRSFERLSASAGMRPIRLHDLRHSAASLLKRSGVAPRDAMEILGHSRISVTMEIYTHSDEETQREGLGRLGGALFGDEDENQNGDS
ncbi:site-specific integrase [Spiractinospora alimapuensis]|uniref:tyrosine-type recombinase/integrase n=1 Tax=Spiractinospora alimapuensis TaxID=2820884 RepID=UPI001F42E56B|nr:site-specific integrase [Spiractinospora alimapuensis]QVQ50492.1 site-specific integrase [Spiractinospora alimapuensis]